MRSATPAFLGNLEYCGEDSPFTANAALKFDRYHSIPLFQRPLSSKKFNSFCFDMNISGCGQIAVEAGRTSLRGANNQQVRKGWAVTHALHFPTAKSPASNRPHCS